MKLLRPRNRNRLTASAARNANSSAATSTMATTASDTRIEVQKLGSSSTRRKFDSVAPTGKNVGSGVCSLFSGRNALLTIQ